jgi:aryl-alcohol dehydrogenase-like predicted oxidoreductase
MPKYRIDYYEVHVQQYTVEAESEEEARTAFMEGEAEMVGESEYHGELTEQYQNITSFEVALDEQG